MLSATAVSKAIGLLVTTIVVRYVIMYLVSPLKELPGPFAAKFTDFWRFYDYWCCSQIDTHQALHKEHGSVVRIGPNMVSLSDPDLIKQVYSTRGDFLKSDFYEVADASSQGQRLENVFSTRSHKFHARYLRPYQKYFSLNTIIGKEHLADNMARLLCEQLESRFVNGRNVGVTVDIAEWIEYTAWDFDWEMTFSHDMGFLKTGTDVDGMIHTGEKIMRYLGCIGQIPWADRWLGKYEKCPIKFATFENAAFYCFQRVMERAQSADKDTKDDFLANFFEAKELFPDIVSENEIVSYLMMNVLAGADTTAIVMKCITWNLLAHPESKAKLLAELDAASLSFPPRFEQTRDLPYLNAVIREGMRMHPVIGGILERIVPAGGLTSPDGKYIAPGTKVGINAWVTSRDENIYGSDTNEFKPERWLQGKGETDEAFAGRLKKMDAADLTFGGGNRVCVGRHMANLEIQKLVTTLFSRYDMQLDNSRKQWSVRRWWFTFVDNIQVKVERRPGVDAVKGSL